MVRNSETQLAQDFDFLDQGEFRDKYVVGSESNQIRFYIGGIRCAKCIHKLESLPTKVQGLNQVRVEMGNHLAHVEVDPNVLSFSQAARHLSDLGFKVIPLEKENSASDSERLESREELVRLAVGGACAANIMTFSFATYLGAVEWSTIFSWLSFALYLPVVGYVARPFYRNAWQSLKRRELSIDLPMTVASLAGFVFSTIQLLRGQADIYFDSLSGFLFLILISRWAQKKLQKKYLRSEALTENLQLQKYRSPSATGWSWRPIETLKPQDVLLLKYQEILPADSILISGHAHVSLAWLTGEADAKFYLSGAQIPAGAKLISDEASFAVVRPLSQTSFGQILNEIQRFSLSRNHTMLAADRWAQWLLASVFLIAAIYLGLHWSISPEEAVQRSLALLIIACPCAMAFGTPLALAASMRKAERRGLIIRDANALSLTPKIQTIYFDKTGTLTDSELSLLNSIETVPAIYQKIVLSLENQSHHPIAFAFRRAFPIPHTLPPVDGWREVPGKGVSGYLFGKHYALKPSIDPGKEVSCSLIEDEKVIFRFIFSTEPKGDALATLRELRSLDYRVALLSGDNDLSVQTLAARLEFKPEDVYSGLSPFDKAKIIENTPGSMMVGDGINDSLAMTQSTIGVAACGGMESSLRSAKVYLANSGVNGVLELLRIGESTHRLIRDNLLIATAYNAATGTAALLGFINPFVAAVLMPISSGIILLHTHLRGRN